MLPDDSGVSPQKQSDVSPRAMSIARMIDRLGPGCHRIELTKDDFPSSPWELSISQLQVVTKVTKTMANLDRKE